MINYYIEASGINVNIPKTNSNPITQEVFFFFFVISIVAECFEFSNLTKNVIQTPNFPYFIIYIEITVTRFFVESVRFEIRTYYWSTRLTALTVQQFSVITFVVFDLISVSFIIRCCTLRFNCTCASRYVKITIIIVSPILPGFVVSGWFANIFIKQSITKADV